MAAYKLSVRNGPAWERWGLLFRSILGLPYVIALPTLWTFGFLGSSALLNLLWEILPGYLVCHQVLES